jgi:hypothetical protein
MSIKEQIKSTIEEQDLKVTEIKNALKTKIEALPDSPHVKRLSSSPTCFAGCSSQLFKHDNWTPFFHDHQAQYQFVIDLIERTPLENIISKIEHIVEKKSFRKPNQDTVKFHPEVVKQLKGILHAR